MEFTNNPRPIGPGRPAPGSSARPVPGRRMFNDFAPRPMAPQNRPMPSPATAAPRPAVTPMPATSLPPAKPFAQPAARPLTPPAPQPAAAHHPTLSHTSVHPAHHALQQAHHQAAAAQMRPAGNQAASQLQPPALSRTPDDTQDVPYPSSRYATDKEPKAGKPRNTTAHAGLVGFICFVVLAGVLLSPILPGKILDNFPGSSVSQSSGEQSLACLHDPTNNSISTSYHGKFGSPLNYKYATTTTQRATCDGKQQSADVGHMSQFSPLALAIDAVIALAAAIGVAKIWGIVFGKKD